MRLLLATLLVLTIEAVVLLAFGYIIPGFRVPGIEAAFIWVLIFTAFNLVLRPILIFITIPFTVLSFGLFSLVINFWSILISAQVLPGFEVDGWGAAILVTLGMTLVQILTPGLVPADSTGAIYYWMARRASRKYRKPGENAPGIYMLEIDGLSEPMLQHAIELGYVPNIASWVRSGNYRLVEYDCGAPCQTMSCQSGILYGDNWDIPAFRWFEKESNRLLVANHPEDGAEIERRRNKDTELLAPHGTGVSNLVSGGAQRNIMVGSKLRVVPGSFTWRSNNYFVFFLNPYNFPRTLIMVIRELAVELWERNMQRIRNIQPRVRRDLVFLGERIGTVPMLRDIGSYLLMVDVANGVPSAYMTFLGYDVVAHHAGPQSRDALRTLRGIDRRIGSIARTAWRYRPDSLVIVLADHGQSHGWTFLQRYGESLQQLTERLMADGGLVHFSADEHEGLAQLDSLFTELGVQGRFGSTTSFAARTEGERDPAREVSASEADVVVCGSGNLGLIYFKRFEGRAMLEELAECFPNVVQGIVAHEGVSFVVVKSEQRGSLVIAKDGVRYLATGEVEGQDPLAPLGPNALRQVERMDSFPHAPDILVNSVYDPVSGEVPAFEELVGSHGGFGGLQTRPFLCFPDHLELDPAEIRDANDVHTVLLRWRAGLPGASGSQPLQTLQATTDGLTQPVAE